MFKEDITSDELNILPANAFNGTIHVIDRHEQCADAITYLKGQTLLGFDTETRPSFRKGRRNKVSLLQLSTHDHAFLFRLHQVGLPRDLVAIFENEKIVKAGVAIKDDIAALKHLNAFMPRNFVELQSYVKDFNIGCNSLQKISAIVLGFTISKRQQLTNWEVVQLTQAQQVYAATDAWVCYEVYKRLQY